jgi:hypothetical protein
MDPSEQLGLAVEELALRWRCERDAIIRRIQKGLMKAFHLPVEKKRRKRKYYVRVIPWSEIHRIERENLGNV